MANSAEWLVINDFSPGIHSDRHGANTTPYPTANQSNVSMRDMIEPRENLPASGSVDNFSYRGKNAPGIATVKHTWGCTADNSGALIPMPLGIGRFSGVVADTFGALTDTAPTFYPTGRQGTYLLDARVQGFVDAGVESPTGCDVVYQAWGTFYDPLHVSTYRQLVFITVNRQQVGVTARWWTIYWNKYSDTNPTLHKLPAVNLALLRAIGGQLDVDGYPVYDSNYIQNVLGFTVFGSDSQVVKNQITTGWQQGGGAIPAEEIALTNYNLVTSTTTYPKSIGGASALIGVYPNPIIFDPASFNPTAVSLGLPRIVGDSGARPASIAIAHQGRLVLAGVEPTFGISSETDPATMYNEWADHIYYSPVYNPGLNVGLTGAARVAAYTPPQYNHEIAGDDVTAPIGTMGSITADELLIVKHRNGGVVLRGDMDNPTAQSLPYLEPTSGIVCHGIGTPLGYVYGSRNGIFVWKGGEQTEKLSEQLDGFFWNHAVLAGGDEVLYSGNRGRMAYWHPFIAIPNNWIYNSVLASWWRLEPDTTVKYNCYDVSSKDGCLFGFHYKNEPGAHYAYFRYDTEQLRDHYSWRSQPLMDTRDRYYSVENVEVTLTRQDTTSGPYAGVYHMTIYLYGIDDMGNEIDRSFKLDITSGTRQTVLLDVLASSAANRGVFNARAVSVRIAFDVTDETIYQGPAPKVHQIRLGVTARNRVQTRVTTRI